MTVDLAPGQCWKPTLSGGASPPREIVAVADDIVTYRTVGTGDHRTHRLNVVDFGVWAVYWQAFKSEVTQ